MTFLNAILLAGLAALTIPIIIHLLHRRRVVIVRWGAMHLLETALRKNRRRLRWEQLLLLLVRCTIAALLAFALARPVLTRFSILAGGVSSSVVVLLDDSYSMDYAAGAQSNFDLARQSVAQIIGQLTPGSEIAVVSLSRPDGPPLVPPTSDRDLAARTLDQLASGFGRANLPAALQTAAALLDRMQHSFREVVIVTDFQRLNWASAEQPARQRALDRLRAQPLPPQLTFYHVGAEGRDNIAVESLEFSRLILGVGQPLQVRANLRNFGDRPHRDLRVYFRVDGRERSAAQVILAPGEQQQLLFTHAFDAPGSHVLEVHADADSLQADNRALASIPVWDRLPVLLVNGDPSPLPLRGETDFLEIALQPFGQARADLADLVTTRVIETADLNRTELSRVRVTVLANVAALRDPQLDALRDFVRDGGGLLIFPGNQTRLDWHNRVLFPNGLLPHPLATLAGSLGESALPARIVSEHFTHPALELFNDPRNGSLADAEIRLWFKTRPTTRTNELAPVVLARLDNGDPFLIEQKSGEGRVILCTTAADADWSNLPTRPAYVPLMQRLVTYLASTVYPPRNVEVGRPLIAFLPRADLGKTAVLTDPSGKRTELPVQHRGAQAVVEWTQTHQPGLYELTAPDGALIHFVASVPRDESDLAQLTDAELRAIAAGLDAGYVKSWSEYADLDQTRRYGREIWKPLLWAVLALAFTELVLQQWFTRRPAA